MRFLLLKILTVLLLSSCADRIEDEAGMWEKETVQYKQIPGVDPDLLSLDIYFYGQRSVKRPIVIWVHGGGWAIGDKANKINDKVNLFTSNNWLFVSLNYRLSPFPYRPDDPARVRFPDHNNDIADAISWIYRNIDAYGGDPERLVLIGHSAGAHLVSLTGTDSRYLEDRGVPFYILKGVVSVDTRAYDVQAMLNLGASDMYRNAFGDDPSVLRNASPVYHLRKGREYPDFFVVKRGSPARLAYADAFISALKEVPVSVSQVETPMYTHSGVNNAIGRPGEQFVTPPLIDFIRSCFSSNVN